MISTKVSNCKRLLRFSSENVSVYSKELMKYESDREIYNQQYLEERNKRLVELQDLKIVIPTEFQDIVNEINNLG